MPDHRLAHVSRRRLLRAAGGGLLAATADAGLLAWFVREDTHTPADGPARPGRPLTAAGDQAFLHVIAHPDDALYFMNPDLEQAVRSGARSVTLCLTGGEADGRNAAPGTRGTVRSDRPAFARARTNGLRAAHALMATGDTDSPWDLRPLSLLPGLQAELHTLRAAPQHQLIFLGLVEARAVWTPRATSLRGLWLGAVATLPTLRPSGTPLPAVRHYTREQLVHTLTAVLERVRPTVLRTLDPNAVHSSRPPQPAPDPRLAGPRYFDHQDHTAAAHFAQAALAAYRSRPDHPPALMEHYLGYELGVLPRSLDTGAARRKERLLAVYGWSDGRRCGDPAGCGDRKVGGAAHHGAPWNWTRSTRLRAPGSNAWVRPLKDRRLAAFAVLDGRAWCWSETRPGSGRFTGPAPLGDGPAGGVLLDGQIHAVRRPDGVLRLFATRTVLPDGTTAHRREVTTTVQTGTTRDGTPLFAPWEPLGAPERDPLRSLETGFPVAVADDEGRAYVFVRTWDGGVAWRRGGPHGGRWTPWRRLEGPAGTPQASPRIVDGIDACVDSDGRIHLIAPSGGTVHHWVSREPGAPPGPAAATGLPAAAGPVSLVPVADGAVRALFRRAGTAQVLIAERRHPYGVWRVAARCAPVGGHGRVAAASSGPGGRMVIAVRDDAGEVRVAMAEAAPEPWGTGRVPHSGAAGVARDAAGRAVVLAVGNDGRLYTARQRAAGRTAPFGAWAQAGSRGWGDG